MWSQDPFPGWNGSTGVPRAACGTCVVSGACARAAPLPAPSPCTACAGMVFPNVLRAMEEFPVVTAHKQLSQALPMDCIAHTADPRVIIACLELLL